MGRIQLPEYHIYGLDFKYYLDCFDPLYSMAKIFTNICGRNIVEQTFYSIDFCNIKIKVILVPYDLIGFALIM